MKTGLNILLCTVVWVCCATTGWADPPWLAVNGANGDYLTLNYYIDEDAGDSETVYVDFYPNEGNVTKAQVWSNLGRRDHVTLEGSDAVSDPGPDAASTNYFAAFPMTDQGNGKWSLAMPANKTGAYRLTARYKVTGDSNWRWYQGRNTAIVVSPKKARDVILYEMQVNAINATGDDFGSRSTFEDLHDPAKNANLDYFSDLGVNTLWIQPIHPIGSHYCINVEGPGSPYSIQNMWEVAPHMGQGNTRAAAMSAFTNFANAAKAKNIDFFFDIIFNHTSWDAEIGRDPDDPTQPASNPAAKMKDLVPNWYSRYNSVSLPCGEYDYNQASFDFGNPAQNSNQMGPAPAERNDFGKWPDVADLYWGRYNALYDPQTSSDSYWTIEPDVAGADVERMTRFFGHFAQYWIEKSGGVLGGFRCDYAQGLPPQAWEYIVNTARKVKWDFIFMAESLDGGNVSKRAGRHMDIINQNWVWQVLENGGNSTGLRSIIDANKTAYGYAGIMRGLINHDQNAPEDKWYSFSRYAVGAAVDGAPQLYQGQELGYVNHWGFSQFRNQFDRWIPHIFKWHNMQTLWSNRDAVLEDAYQRVNKARLSNIAIRLHDQWYLDQTDGSPHQQIFSVLKYDKFGWDPAHQNVVLCFVNLTPFTAQNGLFKLSDVQAIYLDPARNYNIRDLASSNPGQYIWETARTGADIRDNGFYVGMDNTANGLVQFLKLEDQTGGGGGSIAIDSVSTYPAQGDITSTDDLWVDVWTSPIEGGQTVNLVYSNSVTTLWQVVPMNWSENDEGSNRSHWNYNLGTFPPNASIQFAVEAIPAGGGNSVWDNNSGSDYVRTVNAGGGGGPCDEENNVQWAGDGMAYIGDPGTPTSLYVEVCSWPIKPEQSASIVFCLGDCGESATNAVWSADDMYWIRNAEYVWTNEFSEVGTNQNSVWGYNFGPLSAGTQVRWATVVKNASCGNEAWDNNSGADYTAIIPGLEDTNGNGIPDSWEYGFFGHLINADDDDDGDGVSNKDEFKAGTDPTDANSVFAFNLAGMSAGATPRPSVRWEGMPQKSYRVWVSRSGVQGPYANQLGVRATVGSSAHSLEIDDPQAANYPFSFYRIDVTDQGGQTETVTVGATPGSTTFASEGGITITLTVVGDNVISSTYMVEGEAPVSYANGQTIVFGAGLAPGQSKTLTLDAATGSGSSDHKVYMYTRSAGIATTNVGGTHHYPASGSINSNDEVWINTSASPTGSSVNAYVVYCAGSCAGDWTLVPMTRNPGWDDETREWWNVSLGSFDAGITVQYVILVVDGEGTEHWDNNNGLNYAFTVNGGGGGGETGGSKPYSTNPSYGKRVANGAITIDGSNNGGKWTTNNLVAIDMANDDPRSLGDNWTMHEGPIDLTHVWASWDDDYLYIAWQYVDVTDIIDPANAGSAGGGKISNNDGILQWIVLDTKSGGATNDVWSKKNQWAGANKPNYQIYLAGSLWQGYFSREVDGEFALDDGGVNYKSIAAAGITVAKGSLYAGGNELWGVGDADNRHDGDAPNRNFIAEGHNTTRDSFYEMRIPLTELQITAAHIESNGIGIMIGGGSDSTMDCIPHDETTLDTPGVESYNSSFEWSDWDRFTSPFARIGN